MITMPDYRWLYRARFHSSVDGDTLRVEVDSGFYSRHVITLRLTGVNAPELFRGLPDERERGAAARDYVERWIQSEPGWNQHATSGVRQRGGWVFLIETEADRQSFNRYLGRVWRISDEHCLNDDLIDAGHAEGA